jgi:primase/DNA polymerase family protein
VEVVLDQHPPLLKIQPEGIPEELKRRKQWLVSNVRWVPDEKGGEKLDKPPMNIKGDVVDLTDPGNWLSWGEALIAVLSGSFNALGFVFDPEVFGPDDSFTGIDLDGAIDLATGHIDKRAESLVGALSSWTERSISGSGLHIIVRAKLPAGGREKHDPGKKHSGVAMYDSGRWFVLTGHRFPGTPAEIFDRQQQIDAIHAEVFAAKKKRTPTPRKKTAGSDNGAIPDDDAMLERARKAANGEWVGRLFECGDIGAYPSHSEADLALCEHLRFWTNGNRDRIDRLFRRSALMRPEWDDKRPGGTYGSITIDKALGGNGYAGGAADGAGGMGEDPNPAAGNESTADEPKSPGASPDGGGGGDRTPPPTDTNPWPAPHNPAALHGLAGDFVRLVEPHTEADPAGLLVEFLIGVANLAGRNVYRRVGPTYHFGNLFDILVGPTGSGGRKGSAWAEVRRVLDLVDASWTTSHILGGLASGEGLIHIVRDPVTKTEIDKKTGEEKEIVVDRGVDDKRTLVVENEFARTLKVCERRESTLSAIMRQAWDSGDLRIINRNSPLRATGAHISIIGHITTEELARWLNSTEAANGFANRISWNCVRRSKLLPEGGSLTDEDFIPLVEALREVIAWTRTPRELTLSEEARAAWTAIYPKLTEGRPGLLGAILARAEAQVLRFTIVYAMLDRSDTVELVHLRAALAVWERAEASARHVFGERLGDPDADDILEALRNSGDDGLTRTEISEIFSHNLSRGRIERALATLRQANLATPESVQTGGRPTERWRCVKRG